MDIVSNASTCAWPSAFPGQGRPGTGRRAPAASRRRTADVSRQPLRQPPPALLQRRGDVLDASLAPRPPGFPGAARARLLLSPACRRGRATGPGQRQPGGRGERLSRCPGAATAAGPGGTAHARGPGGGDGLRRRHPPAPARPRGPGLAPAPAPGAADPGAAAQPGRWPAPAARRQRTWRTRRRRSLRTLERPAGVPPAPPGAPDPAGHPAHRRALRQGQRIPPRRASPRGPQPGLQLFVASSSGNDDPRPLQFLLGNSDLLLGIDDKQLYNSQSIKSLLLGSYAKNRALLGPTAAFVKAGSLASSYSDQEDWLDTLDELLGQAPRHWPLSLYPGHFKVLGNRQVARSLGIDLASDADLGRRLAEGEEP